MVKVAPAELWHGGPAAGGDCGPERSRGVGAWWVVLKNIIKKTCCCYSN